MTYNQWEIWNAIVAYKDNPNESKRRPVLVLGYQELSVIVLKKTGTERREYKIVNWSESGLYKQSYIVCDEKLLLRESELQDKLGVLHPKDIIGRLSRTQRRRGGI